jgi:hypothetical protein
LTLRRRKHTEPSPRVRRDRSGFTHCDARPRVQSEPFPARPPGPANPSRALQKSSLVFVRNNSSEATDRPASLTAEAEPLERRAAGLLPNGSRLVARLQAAVSTAVKSPVVAAIQYNYERDGEIIIPAGTKAFGDLQQAYGFSRPL